jgi:DNA-damage-inducible protein D
LDEKIIKVKLKYSIDGKNYTTDVADIKTVFRILQSVSSPKVEPFKKWLARVGYERPELAVKRARALYKGWLD